MKVALASYLFGPDMAHGAVMAPWHVARALSAEGVDVVVLSTQRDRQATIEWLDGVKVHRFRPLNLYWVADKDRQPLWTKVIWQLIDIWNPHTYRQVREILMQERPDLLNVHKLRGLSPSVWAAARSLGIPVVQTCHDYELMSPEGTLSGQVGSWASQGAWPLRGYTWLRARFSEVVAAATAPSQYTLQILITHGLFPRATQTVIPNSHGLTLHEVDQRSSRRPRPSTQSSALVRLLYLGRLEVSKGVRLLCSAFTRCAAQYPGLHLDIAGWGSAEADLREQYGKHAQITFHGTVQGQAKQRLLSECDVVTTPSIVPESMGMTIVEAFASGKPVLASRIGGMPELIREGQTGWLTPAGDEQALATALSWIANNLDPVRSMANQCFAAAYPYCLEHIAAQYRSVYAQVLREA